jgi:hypothetical protein
MYIEAGPRVEVTLLVCDPQQYIFKNTRLAGEVFINGSRLICAAACI